MRRYAPWAIGLVLFVIYFGVFEALGFRDPANYATLSYTVSNAAANWPFFNSLVSFTAGVLLCHFFWPWRANPLGKGGG